MKTGILLLLSTVFVGSNAFAQLTISQNEFYYVSDEINMVLADPTGTSAGASGTGITWDFSTIGSTGVTQTTTVANNASGAFNTANLIMNMPTGKKYYVQESSTDSYLQGITNSTPGGDTIYFTNLKMSRRPISYMTYYTDTYTVNTPSTGMFGRGYVTTTVDGSGVILTPRGTYNDVLRVKRVQSQTDTTGTAVKTTTMISYMWFDSVHRAPLLRIDSTIGVVGAENTIMFQAPSTGIDPVAGESIVYRGHIHNNELTLFGDFKSGRNYVVTAFNISGAAIIDEQFTAQGSNPRFTAAMQLTPGIYMVTISPADDRTNRQTIKVLKQ